MERMITLMVLAAALAYAGTNYTEMLEAYAAHDNTNAYRFAGGVLAAPNTPHEAEQAKRIRRDIEERRLLYSLRDDSGLFLFYTGNILAHVISFEAVLSAVDYWADPSLVAGIGLAGVSAGVLTSIVSTLRYPMPFGKMLAIEFFSSAVAMHTLAVDVVLLPNISFGSIMMVPATMSITSLAARYLAIIATCNDDYYSAGRYSLLVNGYAWGLFFAGLGVLSSQWINPCTLLAVNLIADGAAIGSWFLHDALKWSSARVWLTSLGGATGLVTGFFALSMARFMLPDYRLYFLYFGACAATGIAVTALATMGFAPETDGTPLSLTVMPSVDGNGSLSMSAQVSWTF
ncbi:MAG: hypothetical protein AABZ39_00890 [Spirochaetota bacterium]